MMNTLFNQLKVLYLLFAAAFMLPLLGWAQAPVANFTVNPASLKGCAPLIISCTGTSTGTKANSTYSWTLTPGSKFGSGVNSTVTIQAAGTYEIMLTVTNPGTGGGTSTKKVTVEVYAKPTPNFTVPSAIGCAPFPVTFANTSTAGSGALATTTWSPGISPNSNTTGTNSLTRTYTAPGVYTVTMTVNNDKGCSASKTFTNAITVLAQPVVKFKANDSTNCTAPFTVTYTNQSVTAAGVTYTHKWTFPGGTPSSFTGVTPPPVTYNTPGKHDVKLVVSSATAGTCKDSLTKIGYIDIKNYAPTVTASPVNPCPGDIVTFTGNPGAMPVGVTATDYVWLGGGGLNPINTTVPTATLSYPLSFSGSATAKMNVTYSDGCVVSVSPTAAINVKARPVADFSSSSLTACKIPANFTLTSTSTLQGGTITGLSWDFTSPPGITPTTSTATAPAITVNAFGSYAITLGVTGSNGCKDTITKYSFLDVSAPKSNFVATPAQGCLPLSTSLVSTSTANEPIASYAWTITAGTGAPVLPTPATSTNNPFPVTITNQGGYTVKLDITTVNGCTATSTSNNLIRAGNKIPSSGTISKNTNVCVDEDVSFVATSANPTNTNLYQWDFIATPSIKPSNFVAGTGTGTVAPFTGGTPKYSYSAPGTYSVALITNNFGCRDTAMLGTVVVNAPQASFGLNDTTFCKIPATVQFTNNSVGPATYSWKVLDTTTTTPTVLYSATTTTIAPPGSFAFSGLVGTYKVQLIATGTGSNTCVDTSELKVNFGNPKASFTVSSTKGCYPFTPTFTSTSTNASQFTWDFPNGLPATAAGATTTTTYANVGTYTAKLKVSDAFGCIDSIVSTTAQTVSVVGPTASFTPNLPTAGITSICKGSKITFTNASAASAGQNLTSFAWTFTGGNPATSSAANPPAVTYNTPNLPNPPNSGAGSYPVSLTVTDNFGCTATATFDSVEVTFPSISFTVSDASSCVGNPIGFNSVALGAGTTTVDWKVFTNGTTTLVSPKPFQGDSVSFIFPATGSYDVRAIITDKNGCKDSVSQSNAVFMETYPSFTASPTTAVCPPLTVQFTNTSTSVITNFVWDFGGGASSNLQNPSFTYILPGKYDVSLVATHEDGCVDTLTQQQMIDIQGPSLDTVIMPKKVCKGQEVEFTIEVKDVQNGVIFPEGVAAGNSIAITPATTGKETVKVKYTYTAAGIYHPDVYLFGSSNCFLSYALTDSIQVDDSPTAQMALSDSSGCQPFKVTLIDQSTAGATSPITSWSWDMGDGSSALSGQTPAPFTYAADGNFLATLVVTDANGCKGEPSFVNVTVFPKPTADFSATPTTGCSPITIKFTDKTAAPVATAWAWDFGVAGGTSATQNPTFIYTADGNYAVKLTVTTADGCKDTTSIPNYIQLSHPVAQISIDSSNFCSPYKPTFDAKGSSGSVAIKDYTWVITNNATGAVVSTATTTTTTYNGYTFNSGGSFSAYVIVTTVNGCKDTAKLSTNIIVTTPTTPSPVVLRRVSTTGDNAISVVWEASTASDFKEYQVFRDTYTTPIATIPVQNITSYVDASPTLNTAVPHAYKVVQVNFCNVKSNLNTTIEHKTSALSANTALNQVDLTWTPYVGWNVSEYVIVRASKTTPYDAKLDTILAKVPGTQISYVDKALFCNAKVYYRVHALRATGGPDTSYSNVSIGQAVPTLDDSMSVRAASVINDQFVQVTWLPFTGQKLKEYELERSVNGTTYKKIATISDVTKTSYDDLTSQVDDTSYSYRIIAIDSCDNRSPIARIGKSILLKVSLAPGNSRVLTWTPYQEWKNGVASYRVERYDETSGTFKAIASNLPSIVNNYIDTQFPEGSTAFVYRVYAIQGGNNPASAYSNEDSVGLPSKAYVANAFTPNGDQFNEYFFPPTLNVKTGTLRVFDRFGHIVFETEDFKKGWDGKKNGVDSPEDVYGFTFEGIGEDGQAINPVSGTFTLLR